MLHAEQPSESVDAGKVLIAHVRAERQGGAGREVYSGSLATDSDSKGSWVPVNVEGNVAEGIIGFADSVFCPSSIHMSGLAVDSALRVLTCSRSTGLTLTWNPDTHTDSVEIMIAELCDPYSTVENDYAAEPVVIRTSDDGMHVITSADLNTFAPSVERVALHISRSIQRVVAYSSQRVLLVGKAHTWAVLRLEDRTPNTENQRQ
jgi:hypothetical protein